MKKIIITAVLLGAFAWNGASAQVTDEAIGQVLRSVERNNATLAARNKLADARTLEARTGNSLENPEVEFNYNWGTPASLGNTGEVTVTQSFDWPGTYVYRNRMARSLGEQYGHEFAAYRQGLLLEAQSLCLEIIALRRQGDILGRALDNARKIADIMARREKAGDANILEANKAQFELVGAQNAYKLNEIELAAAENRLVNLNGGEPMAFAAAEFPARPFLAGQDEMLARYEEMSPGLLALMSEKSAADNDVRMSRSKAMPKFSAGYKHEYVPGRNEKFKGVVVGMSIPMFGNRNNVKRARAQAAFAESQYRSGLVDVRSDLAELYARAALLAASLDDYRRITDNAHSAELLNRAIEAGQISVTDYFAELAPIYEAGLTLVEVERDYHLACARIMMIEL